MKRRSHSRSHPEYGQLRLASRRHDVPGRPGAKPDETQEALDDPGFAELMTFSDLAFVVGMESPTLVLLGSGAYLG
jgi:hypothetical protein